MANTDYTIKPLKGIEGYQLMQVVYFLLRSAYYTPETNPQGLKIEPYFQWIGTLKDAELDSYLGKVAVLTADISTQYWNVILKNALFKGDPIIPEAIQTIPADTLVYIIKEGMKKVLAIQLPF